MRRASDLPRRRRLTGRAIVITIAVLFLAVAVFGRAIARIYVEYLWYSSLDRSDVFWTRLGAQATLFALFAAIFLVLAFGNLAIADRLAPRTFPANVHPFVERFHEVFGRRLVLVRYAVALAVGLILAFPTTTQWQNWLMFRNASSFQLSDPQFDVDVGFYVFRLPFVSFALDWIFVATIVVLLLTAAAHVLNGGVVFASAVPTIRAATKAHLAVLLALLAALKAADYWVTRYDKTNERRGFVQGATYTVVNAELPALMLLLLVAVLTAGLFLWSVRTGSWRLPIVASALWLVIALLGGIIYPAVVQRLIVRPDQQSRELSYIDRNIDATKAAFAIDQVGVGESQQFGTLTSADLEADLEPLHDARLLNPVEMLSRFRVDQGEDAGLIINDLDVDRYPVEDDWSQVLIAARELDLNTIANRSWQGQHLISTRGCGLVTASSSQVLENDRPDYRRVELTRPELYFSPGLEGYAITNTDQVERGCEEELRTAGVAVEEYGGEYGVEMSSFGRRAAFALAFLDYNVVGSQAINDDSQMLWIRDVRERARKLAPFLSFDGDPYPVAHDGHVVWIIDAFTTTSRYPYAQRIGGVQATLGAGTGLSSSDNYVRNSVKAVVDGYDGSVTFYIVDPDDPILQTWDKAFPGLFTPGEEIPDDLRDHFRYPEDLFRVQTELYSKYRLEAVDFFDRQGAWSVAQAPSTVPRGNAATGEVTVGTAGTGAAGSSDFATESGAARFTPYYTYFENDDGEEEFVMMRPFVPFSSDDQRTELQSYMTVSSDPDSYGELTVYPVSTATGGLPDGPLTVAARLESDDVISPQITFLNNEDGGTQVRYGDLQLVPIADGLLWLRPLYVSVSQASQQVRSVAEYRYVLASHNGRNAYGESLGDALGELFDGFDADIGDRVAAPSDPSATPDDPPDVPDPTAPPPDGTVPTTTEPATTGPSAPTTEPTIDIDPDASATELLEQADELLAEADEALRDRGDLGEYQRLVRQAGQLIDAARTKLTPATTTASTTAPPPTTGG